VTLNPKVWATTPWGLILQEVIFIKEKNKGREKWALTNQ
jgi:hypothetical protein